MKTTSNVCKDDIRTNLLNRWKCAKWKGILCKEFADDFNAYMDCLIAKGYKGERFIFKENRNKPLSPSNIVFSNNRKFLNRVHGESNTRLFRAWHHIHDDKRIAIDDAWIKDYSAFRDWALANGYDESIGMTHFKRRNKNEGWTQSNTYVTTVVNPNGVFLTHNGVTMNISQWAKLLGVSKQMIWARLFICKQTAEEALTFNIKAITEK